MSTIPSAAARVFWGVQTVLTISGATYAAVSKVATKWGYKIHEELVTGQNAPYLGTGGFHGEIDLDSLGSSDSRWENAVSTTSGIVTTLGLTWKEQDTQGTISARTWTASGKFTEYQKDVSKDGVVNYKLKMILAAEPVVV